MKTLAFVIIGLSFVGAVGTGSLSDPALGGGAAPGLMGPGVVTCTLGESC
ncbi:MAG: hypothetical protein QNJ20_05400 [Paracoccaceae bacterium]|nr:hypothetical protein [Paracoccaceae bacterium]